MSQKKEKSYKQTMKLNRFLANKYVIAARCIFTDIFFFLLVSYIVNIICNFPKLVKNLEHPEKYIGLSNLIPDFVKISTYPILKVIYIIVGVGCLLCNIVMIYQIRSGFAEENLNVGQKGIARWTTNKEIKEQYREIPDRDKEFPGYGGTIISRIGKNLYIDHSVINNLIIGITRSGKGEMFVIPSIDVYSRAEKKTSMIITDPKMELYKCSKETLEKRGYIVHLLNLDDPLHSMGFNPLEQIKEEYMNGNYAEAELLAQAFSYSIFNPDSPANTDSFWQDTSSSLLTALILAHVDDCLREHEEEKINMYSIINTFTELATITNEKNPNVTALDSYFAQRPALDRAKMKYAGIQVTGDRTKGSIFASMLTKLTIFTFENIAKMTAKSSVQLENIGFGEKPMAIFLGIPDYDKSTHFLATVFIRQLTFVLEKKATRAKTGKCDRPVKFICDEFGNLPAIEGMANIITVCLGRNISFDLYIQAHSQMKKLYGDDAETLMGNCGNHIFILTNDDATAKNFSENLGNETIVDIQRSGDKLSMKKHFSESTMEKPLLSMNQLEELQEGECVIKRVMKRRDLKGHRIRPTPIFNSVESGKVFLFRYEYLQNTFPNPDQIDMNKMNPEDCSYIQLENIVFDYRKAFVHYQNRGGGRSVESKRVSELSNGDEIIHLTKHMFGIDINTNTRIIDLIKMINESDAKKEDKQAMISMIEFSMAA